MHGVYRPEAGQCETFLFYYLPRLSNKAYLSVLSTFFCFLLKAHYKNDVSWRVVPPRRAFIICSCLNNNWSRENLIFFRFLSNSHNNRKLKSSISMTRAVAYLPASGHKHLNCLCFILNASINEKHTVHRLKYTTDYTDRSFHANVNLKNG